MVEEKFGQPFVHIFCDISLALENAPTVPIEVKKETKRKQVFALAMDTLSSEHLKIVLMDKEGNTLKTRDRFYSHQISAITSDFDGNIYVAVGYDSDGVIKMDSELNTVWLISLDYSYEDIKWYGDRLAVLHNSNSATFVDIDGNKLTTNTSISGSDLYGNNSNIKIKDYEWENLVDAILDNENNTIHLFNEKQYVQYKDSYNVITTLLDPNSDYEIFCATSVYVDEDTLEQLQDDETDDDDETEPL